MKYLFVSFALFIMLAACSKSYLEENPSNQFATPDDLERLKSLLTNDLLMGETPVLGEESADDHYLTSDSYKNLPQQDKNVYTWQPDLFLGKTNIPDYNIPYAQVFTCNMVLEGLDKVNPGIYQKKWNETKGYALFMRSYAYFNLAQVFADAYDSVSAPYTLGISLPHSTDISVIPERASLKQTFDQIITDLHTALSLVPRSATTRNLPARPAIFALLARVNLAKRDYTMAYAMADSCIRLRDSLLDFNTINTNLKFPIEADNKEILYPSRLSSYTNVILGRMNCLVDSILYKTYSDDDLRKVIFFMTNTSGQAIFKNNGTGKGFAFSGLSIGEMYLIRAECAARLDNLQKAIDDINELLEKRYKTGTFNKYAATTYQDVMAIILRERRKELVFRGLRWPDIKRLNKEEAGIILTRFIYGRTIQLLPKSNLYILPVPDDALIGGTIKQNIRN